MQESSDLQFTTPLSLRYAPVRAYERSQMGQVEPVLRTLARQSPYFRKYPLLRLLKEVARLFQLTHTESLFLLFVVRETNWGAGQLWMKTYAGRVKDLFCFQYDQREYREMILYLLLTSYSVKECLNGRQPALLRRANKICPEFNTALREWSQRHASIITSIHPRMLNRLYSELWQQSRRPQLEDQIDYMATVDQILQICRPYSETRVQKQKAKMSVLMKEAENELWQQKPQKKRKMEKKTEVVAEMCASFSQVEFETVDTCEELKKFMMVGEDGFKNGIIGLPDSVTNEDEEYCESYNLYPEESDSELRIFIKKDPDYDHFSLRFICDESEPNFL